MTATNVEFIRNCQAMDDGELEMVLTIEWAKPGHGEHESAMEVALARGWVVVAGVVLSYN
jgi:hypothetical protein